MSQIPLSKLKEIILDEYRQLTEGVELFTKDNIKKYEKNIIKIFNKVIPYADGIGIGVSGESIIGKFSLDKKNTWPNGYIENSRCGMFTLYNDGELKIEILSWGTYNQRKKVPKFRKSTVKSVEQAVAKSLKYLKLLTNKKYSLDVLPEGKRAGTETGQAAPPKTSKEKKAVKLYGAYIEYKMNSGNSEYGYANQRNQLALKMLKDKFKVPSNLKSKLKDKKYHDKYTDYKSIVWEGKLTESQVAKTILQQLGGNRFIAMTGAKNFGSSSKSLQMKIGRNSKSISHVVITLKSSDLYDMEFIRVRGTSRKVVKKVTGVYADMLGKMFTKYTGMNVRL